MPRGQSPRQSQAQSHSSGGSVCFLRSSVLCGWTVGSALRMPGYKSHLSVAGCVTLGELLNLSGLNFFP